MRSLICMQYAGMDRGPLRALSLILALGLAACVMWQPARFAARTSDIAIWQSALLIWAVCAGVVHGSGLRLQRQRWPPACCISAGKPGNGGAPAPVSPVSAGRRREVMSASGQEIS